MLTGALTFASVPEVYRQGSALFVDDDRASLTLDLKNIEHTDSAGLALLLEWMRSARQQHKVIHFKNVPPQLLSLANLSGLDDILPLG